MVSEVEAAGRPQISVSAKAVALDHPPTTEFDLSALGGGGGKMKVPMGDQYWAEVEAKVQWVIDLFDQIGAGVDAAEAGRTAKALEVREARAALRQDLVRAYIGLKRAGTMLGVALAFEDAAQSHLRTATDLFEQGMIPKNDLLRAQVGLGDAENAKIQAQHGVKLAQANLDRLIGLPAGTEIDPVSEPLATPLPDDAKPFSDQIEALRHAIEASQDRIASLESQGYPTVFVGASYTNKTQQNSTNVYPQVVSGFVGMNWNPDLEGSRSAKVAQAQAERQRLEATLRDAEEQVALAALSYRLDFEAATAQEKAAATTVRSAEENLRVVSERFSQGLATSTDVVEAQSLLAKARADQAQAHFDKAEARARWARMVGQLLPDPVQ